MGVLAEAPRTVASRALVLGGVAGGCGVLAVALAGRAAGLTSRLGAARGGGLAVARPDELVELGVLAVGALALCWLAASAGLAAACLVARGAGRAWRSGEGWVQRYAPAVVRRATVVVVAAGLGTASVTTASAAEPPPATSPTAVATVAADGVPLDLGWVVAGSPSAGPTGPTAEPAPDTASPGAGSPGTTSTPSAPAGTAPPSTATASPAPSAGASTEPGNAPLVPAADAPAASAGPVTSPSAVVAVGGPADALPVPHGPLWAPVPRVPVEAAGATVVVVRGDTLWDIAARHLPPGAGAAEVAAAWPAWYAANAETIGPDPDLILPGQVLTVPATVTR